MRASGLAVLGSRAARLNIAIGLLRATARALFCRSLFRISHFTPPYRIFLRKYSVREFWRYMQLKEKTVDKFYLYTNCRGEAH